MQFAFQLLCTEDLDTNEIIYALNDVEHHLNGSPRDNQKKITELLTLARDGSKVIILVHQVRYSELKLVSAEILETIGCKLQQRFEISPSDTPGVPNVGKIQTFSSEPQPGS